jgi:hypothetical protein
VTDEKGVLHAVVRKGKANEKAGNQTSFWRRRFFAAPFNYTALVDLQP